MVSDIKYLRTEALTIQQKFYIANLKIKLHHGYLKKHFLKEFILKTNGIRS